MQHLDFNELVDTALASLGGSPTSSEVEAAAIRLYEARRLTSGHVLDEIGSIKCSISLAACSSRRSVTQRARVYDHVKKSANSLSEAVLSASSILGLSSLPRMELVVRDSTNLFSGHEHAELLTISEAISQAAFDSSISTVWGPFIDLSLAEEFPKIDLIPEIISSCSNLIPMVQLGTEQDPIEKDTLEAFCLALGISVPLLSESSARVGLVVNGCDRRAFGRRVSSDIKGLSVSAASADVLERAKVVGSHITSACTTCYRLVELEISNGKESEFPTLFSKSDGIRVVQKSDGFSVIGTLSNRLVISSNPDMTELAHTIDTRLTPFCYGTKEAGLLLEILPNN